LVLTDDNFAEAVAKYDYLLVEFYAPWCGHCKKLAPEYEGAAKILAEQDPPITIAKVDATEQKKITEDHGIKGFPTLYFYNNGNRMDYGGGRTTDTIVEWVNKKTGPASLAVDCDTMQSKTAAAGKALAYFGDLSGDLYDAFMSSAVNAKIQDKFQFFHTDDASCASNYGVSAPGVALARDFDESPLSYTGDSNGDAIAEWAKSNSVPSLITFSEDFIEPIFADHNPALILFQEDGTDTAHFATFKEAAQAMKGDILFVESGVSQGIQERLGECGGVSKDDLPALRIVDPQENMLKYAFDGSASSASLDDLRNFVAQFKDGKLAPALKSEEIPEDNSAPLTTVVGKNWDAIINDPTKDVLVKYYAPWCGHCKALAPTWEELANDVADISDLVIADFDATANEVAGLNIRGYPTLKFYAKDNKEGIDYTGDRELDGLKSWLSENSSAYKAARADEPKQEEL
jgi:protein disulfide-isomerase A1